MNIDKLTSSTINTYNWNNKANSISKKISVIMSQTTLAVWALTMSNIWYTDEMQSDAIEPSPQIQSFNELLKLYDDTEIQLDELKKPIRDFIAYHPKYTFYSRSTEVLLDTFSGIAYLIQIDNKIEDQEIKDAYIVILTRWFLDILEYSKKWMVDIQKIKEINNTLVKKNIPTNATICINNLEKTNNVAMIKCFKKVSIQDYRNILNNEELNYKKAQKHIFII